MHNINRLAKYAVIKFCNLKHITITQALMSAISSLWIFNIHQLHTQQ